MCLFITNLGVGALVIETGDRRVLVDAYNTIGSPPEPESGDVLLFTHDDADHFAPDVIPDFGNKEIIIAGPPTIVGPLLRKGRVNLHRIIDLYSNRFSQPMTADLAGITCTCYHTDHFNDWDPLHNSYLIVIDGKRIFITGDSFLTAEMLDHLGDLDVVIVNLVDGPYLKGLASQEEALTRLFDYLRMVENHAGIKCLIPTHMISFPWAVSADVIQAAVMAAGLSKIRVPRNPSERLRID